MKKQTAKHMICANFIVILVLAFFIISVYNGKITTSAIGLPADFKPTIQCLYMMGFLAVNVMSLLLILNKITKKKR